MLKMKKGFTLTEILIVVIILAVLAALVLPRFMAQDERGIVAEAVGMLSAIRQGEAAYLLENAAYTSDLAKLDIDTSPATKFSYSITSASETAFTAQATRLDGKCAGKTVTLTQAGIFAGDHPFGPTPGTGTCS